MSTTNVQALPNVRGRMSYTEFGRGDMRKEHLSDGTNRIAAEFGDRDSRADFIAYCEGLHGIHPKGVNEGFELRVSWATDELSPDNPDDIQRGMEYAYLLCHELAPDSPCWVTMHTDGEGGCVHAHATIANHDERTGQVINKGDTSLYAPRVQAVNDRLSRERGFSVIGDRNKDKTLWAERRMEVGQDSFDQRLGDAVNRAKEKSEDMDSFRRNLDSEGVTLKETSKKDKKTGEETFGWSYRMKDTTGGKQRMRRRRASNLADDLTREGVEGYFQQMQEARQQEQEAAYQQPEAQPVIAEEEPQEVVQTSQEPILESEAEPEQSSYTVYEPDADDVAGMAGELRGAYAKQRRANAQRPDDGFYKRLQGVEGDPSDQLERLRAEVEDARERFHGSKAEVEALKHRKSPSFFASMKLYGFIGGRSQDPLNRLMSRMMAQMFDAMMRRMQEEQRRRQREEVERRLYERRREMWDAEKALKAEENRIGKRKLSPELQRINDKIQRGRADKSLGE